jgi:glucokinase
VTGEDLFVGVDVGRSTRAALVDEDGRIVYQERIATHLESGRALADGLAEVVLSVIAAGASRGSVGAIGIGVPGLVDLRTKRIEVMPNLPDVAAIDLRADISRATGLPVVIDNDANTAVYGEWRCGAARGTRDAIYISIGTGIGAGLIQGGRLQRGARGFAGEFGHFKIAIDGLECSCGSSGCLETVASGPNIVRRTRELLYAQPEFALSPLAEKMARRLGCEDIVEAAIDGDSFARSVLSETAEYLGMAVANVVNLLNVELVVFGGPVMASNAYLLDRVRKEVAFRAFVPAFQSCHLVSATLGEDSGAVGSAMLARDEVARAAAQSVASPTSPRSLP